jgi:hypothetical protein
VTAQDHSGLDKKWAPGLAGMNAMVKALDKVMEEGCMVMAS